eukprot:m.51968 g.51968  ORF g.51968 m.51968 type:complete len:62 (-) comp48394_c0_seq1:1241-1426(-)
MVSSSVFSVFFVFFRVSFIHPAGVRESPPLRRVVLSLMLLLRMSCCRRTPPIPFLDDCLIA